MSLPRCVAGLLSCSTLMGRVGLCAPAPPIGLNEAHPVMPASARLTLACAVVCFFFTPLHQPSLGAQLAQWALPLPLAGARVCPALASCVGVVCSRFSALACH